jgi:hypothetical protein
MADLLTLNGRGTVGTDGKPLVNIVFKVNCDTAIELAGESVFQLPIIRERVEEETKDPHSATGSRGQKEERQRRSNLSQINFVPIRVEHLQSYQSKGKVFCIAGK